MGLPRSHRRSLWARRSERGAAPLELALGVGVLMIPVALAVLSFGPALERRTFARLAAAEAARAVVVSGGDSAAAIAQISAMASNHNIPLGDVRVGLCNAAPGTLPGGASACPAELLPAAAEAAPGSRPMVEAVVEIDIPLINLGFWNTSVGGVTISFEHQAPVDLYRSLPTDG